MPRPTSNMPTPPPSPEWHEFEYLALNDFQKLAERRVVLKQLVDEAEAEIKDLNLDIGAMLQTAGAQTVRYGQHRITLGQSSKGGRLSKERLLELGVPVDTIERATSPKEPGTFYVSVTDITKGDQD